MPTWKMLVLRPHESLVRYTDGITEARLSGPGEAQQGLGHVSYVSPQR
ncbi:hypothetical protein [Streptomyces sp. NPDC001083]